MNANDLKLEDELFHQTMAIPTAFITADKINIQLKLLLGYTYLPA